MNETNKQIETVTENKADTCMRGLESFCTNSRWFSTVAYKSHPASASVPWFPWHEGKVDFFPSWKQNEDGPWLFEDSWIHLWMTSYHPVQEGKGMWDALLSHIKTIQLILRWCDFHFSCERRIKAICWDLEMRERPFASDCSFRSQIDTMEGFLFHRTKATCFRSIQFRIQWSGNVKAFLQERNFFFIRCKHWKIKYGPWVGMHCKANVQKYRRDILGCMNLAWLR